jgi:hypothetical protein
MFCPNCGIEDQTNNQFCRSCGTSLQSVRVVLEEPDAITRSAVNAREMIGRAIAEKISDFEDARDLRTAVYEVLPAIQGFLESPEERLLKKSEERLNKIREGVLTTVSGIAIMIPSLLLSWIIQKEFILIISAVGLLVFLIGLGITMTAAWFGGLTRTPLTARPTIQLEPVEKRNTGSMEDSSRRHSDFRSVTEGTTREL